MSIRSSGEPLPPAAQAVVDLDHQFVTDLGSAINRRLDDPIQSEEGRHLESILYVGSSARRLEEVTEFYLRSAESISVFDLEQNVETLDLFNAMEVARATLKRTMVGVTEYEADPKLSSLYSKFRHGYLKSVVMRISSIPYNKSMYEAKTDQDVAEAEAVLGYMGRAVVMPVVEASSTLFEEALKANAGSVHKHLGYFQHNLLHPLSLDI